jgi:hypothetical protein
MPVRYPGARWRYLAVSLAATALVLSVLLMAAPGPDHDPAAESTAVATLRELVRAELQFAESAAIDTDRDGRGEHGYLGELTGAARLRIDASGRLGHDVLRDPLLPVALAAVVDGTAEREGYLLAVFLPGPDGSWIAEQPDGGGAGCAVAADRAEQTFRAYAWPLAPGRGRRAFFVDQRGIVHAFANADGRYVGRDQPVPADAVETEPATANERGATEPAWQPLR